MVISKTVKRKYEAEESVVGKPSVSVQRDGAIWLNIPGGKCRLQLEELRQINQAAQDAGHEVATLSRRRAEALRRAVERSEIRRQKVKELARLYELKPEDLAPEQEDAAAA